MQVDEAWRDNQAGRIDLTRGGWQLGVAAHDVNNVTVDSHTGSVARVAGAVDDGAAGDEEVDHGQSRGPWRSTVSTGMNHTGWGSKPVTSADQAWTAGSWKIHTLGASAMISACTSP